MKYFITGATGFIGGRIAQQLVAAGHEVVALIRSKAKATELVKLGVALVEGDITDKESMRQPMTGADGVLLASPAMIDLPLLNPRLTDVIEAAKAATQDALDEAVHALVPEFSPAQGEGQSARQTP